ncbi:cytoglobin-2-like [Xyrauchen texanus]|uniref:cytoglobin-2-like n=1 Tax=Xyrauchen texanus TaxID=154827 RepID=UPI0022421D15|nr:cytoglobin-2-like [Xyrauchen texanus]
MGCAISGSGLTPRAPENRDRDTGNEGEAPAHLSEHQIHMIKDSWRVIQEDIAKVGIIMFVRLFETHPECKDVFFLFRDVEDLESLRTSRELRAHGLRLKLFIVNVRSRCLCVRSDWTRLESRTITDKRRDPVIL